MQQWCADSICTPPVHYFVLPAEAMRSDGELQLPTAGYLASRKHSHALVSTAETALKSLRGLQDLPEFVTLLDELGGLRGGLPAEVSSGLLARASLPCLASTNFSCARLASSLPLHDGRKRLFPSCRAAPCRPVGFRAVPATVGPASAARAGASVAPLRPAWWAGPHAGVVPPCQCLSPARCTRLLSNASLVPVHLQCWKPRGSRHRATTPTRHTLRCSPRLSSGCSLSRPNWVGCLPVSSEVCEACR